MSYPQTQSMRGRDFFLEFPVTKIIILAWAALFLASVVQAPVDRWLAFTPATLPGAITGLATYHLVIGASIFTLLIGGLMLWQFGGSLERGWGSRTYLLFLLATNAAAALLMTAGLLLLGLPLGRIAIGTPWFMISSVIVAWAMLNPEEIIRIWFVLPVKAKWVGWATIAILYFGYAASGNWGLGNLLYGLFALGGVAVAYGYVWWRRRWGWVPRGRTARPSARSLRHPASSPFNFLTAPIREWQRRRRIAYLRRTFRFDDEPRRHDD